MSSIPLSRRLAWDLPVKSNSGVILISANLCLSVLISEESQREIDSAPLIDLGDLELEACAHRAARASLVSQLDAYLNEKTKDGFQDIKKNLFANSATTMLAAVTHEIDPCHELGLRRLVLILKCMQSIVSVPETEDAEFN